MKKRMSILLLTIISFWLVSCVVPIVNEGTDVRYKVIFYTNGGTEIASVELVEGAPFLVTSIPTYDDNEFLGWFIDEALTTQLNYTFMPSNDVILYAKWAFNEYQILTIYGFNKLEQIDQSVASYFRPESEPVRSGYKFNGYWLSDNYGVTLSQQWNMDQKLTSNIILYVDWVEEKQSSGQLDNPMVSVSESTLTWPVIPNATGYEVVAFTTVNQKKTELLRQTVTENLFDLSSLTADVYTFTIRAKGDGIISANSVWTTRVVYHLVLDKPINVKVDYESYLLMWDEVKNGTDYIVEYRLKTESNFEFLNQSWNNSTSLDYLSPSVYIFRITTSAPGYVSSVQEYEINYLKLLPVQGLRFDQESFTISWSLPKHATHTIVSRDGIETTQSDTKTLVEKDWIEPGKHVTFSFKSFADTGDYLVSRRSDLSISKLLNPEIEWTNQSLHWDAVEGARNYNILIDGERIGLTSDTSYAFDFSKAGSYQICVQATSPWDYVLSSECTSETVNVYQVEFQANVPGIQELVYLKENLTAEPLINLHEGYDIAGYYSDIDLINAYDFDHKIVANQTIYVKLSPKQVQVEMHLLDALDTIQVKYSSYGDTIEDLVIPTMEGYRFLGYYDSSNYSDNLYFNDQMIQIKPFESLNITLYAHWVRVYKVTLMNYHSNYESIVVNVENNKITNELLTPAKLGNDFKGYTTSTGIYGNQYLDENFMVIRTITQDLTLYPIFVAKQYTVTLHNGDDVPDTQLMYTFNVYIGKINTPTKPGYSFDGYYTEPEGKGTNYFNYKGDSVNHFEYKVISDLYAKWAEAYQLTVVTDEISNQYTVYYFQHLPVLSIPTRDDATFFGYYTEPYGKGTRFYLQSNNISLWTMKSNGTLYAAWIYNVSLNFMGGDAPQNAFTIRYNVALPTLDKPTRTGYIFDGYYTLPNGEGDLVIDNEMKSVHTWSYDHGKTLYAAWSGIEVIMTLDIESIDYIDVTNYVITYDNSIVLPIGVKTGYNFLGWYYTVDDNHHFVTNENGIGLSISKYQTDMTLYPEMKAKIIKVTLDGYIEPGQFLVHFNSEGGREIPSQIVTGEDGLNYPSIPSREGYYFGGWYTQRNGQGNLFDFRQEINQDTQLYAHWYLKEAKRIGIETTATTIYNNQTIKYLFTPAYDTYYVIESFTNPSDMNLFYVTVYDTVAKQQVNQFYHYDRNYNIRLETQVKGGVTYEIQITNMRTGSYPAFWLFLRTGPSTDYADGGKSGLTNGIRYITYGTEYTLPIAPSTDTLLFDGWQAMINSEQVRLTNSLGEGLNTWNITSDITLTQLCGYERYPITYRYNGGYGYSNLPNQYYVGTTTFQLPTLTKTGYTFIGWTKQVEGSEDVEWVTEIEKGTTGALILTAEFEIDQYTVTFVTNGGTSVSPMVLDYNTPIEPSMTERTGYRFVGWYRNASLTTSFSSGSYIKSNITLYAKWELVTYTITYYVDGKSVSLYPMTFNYLSEPMVLPYPSKTGYSFVGWYDNPEFNGFKVTQISKNTSKNIQVYAQFSRNLYELTFYLEGYAQYARLKYHYLEAVVYPEPPTKLGYTFIGWYYGFTNNTKVDFTVMPDGGVDAYARFVKTEYTVTFEYQDADVTGVASIVKRIQESYGVLPIPSKENYTFVGWFTEPEGGIQIKSNTVFTIAEHQILYARYELIHIVSYLNYLKQPLKTDRSVLIGTYTEAEALNDFDDDGYLLLSDNSYIPVSYIWSFTNGYNPFIEEGFTANAEIVGDLPDYITNRNTEGSMWMIPDLNMIQVGTPRNYYIPISGKPEVEVFGGFYMAETETTYYLWYTVRLYAETRGYTFKNPGQEGSMGTIGAKPTMNRNHPVTRIRHHDVFVWLNALSELHMKKAIFTEANGMTYINANMDISPTVQEEIGFGLPTQHQYMMAGRLTNDTTSTNGSIQNRGNYWHPESYASGSKASSLYPEETQKVACSNQTATCPVKSKLPNSLGLYDISGNVNDMIYPYLNSGYGGSYLDIYNNFNFTNVQYNSQHTLQTNFGFRIFMNIYPNAFKINLKTVGERMDYYIPTTVDDIFHVTVRGGFQMAPTETTYGVWKKVYDWALMNNYTFLNNGLGSQTNKDDNLPVTNITILDTMVWLNALSEMNGMTPRYNLPDGKVFKNVNSIGNDFDKITMNQSKGYRLPNPFEWEMAARWHSGNTTNFVVSNNIKEWQKGSTVAGQKNYTMSNYAWYSDGVISLPQPVGTKLANDLGIYDLSGNVSEFSFRVGFNLGYVHGNSYSFPPTINDIAIHHKNFMPMKSSFDFVGFRIILD